MNPTNVEAYKLLSALDFKAADRIVTVVENNISDSNFVVTHLIKQIFDDGKNGLCLVILHNTIGHYQNVGKRLEYNLLEKIKEECAHTVEPLKTIFDDIDSSENCNYLLVDPNLTAKNLFLKIEEKIQDLLDKKSGLIFVLIDDFSHLLDLGLEIKNLVNIINSLANLDDRVNLIIGTHTSGGTDQILCNALMYISDLVINVAPLKSGRSYYVSGVISVARKREKENTYHFKTTDNGVNLFRPGEYVHHILKS